MPVRIVTRGPMAHPWDRWRKRTEDFEGGWGRRAFSKVSGYAGDLELTPVTCRLREKSKNSKPLLPSRYHSMFSRV
ncbi:hypothetical protein TNCV_3351071 [Trichonephila clavipes]|nr:hypothetical protein TNCV_3351071 [Trichonephila clavipes]